MQRRKTKLSTCVYDNCDKDIWERQLSSTVTWASMRAVSKLLEWTSYLKSLEYPGHSRMPPWSMRVKVEVPEVLYERTYEGLPEVRWRARW